MSTETESELLNIVTFPAKEGKGKSDLQFLPQGEKVCCFHRAVSVNEHERQVRCRRCDSVLDPFDYLLSIARREVQLADTVDYLRREEKQRRQNIEKLIQIERNAKSRIRRAGCKEPLPLWQNEVIEK
ncbi:hypothetical protein GKC68_10580 [Pantoea sp. RSPAM1]|uniref:hypothetical protein n=1 Tax=Pantoea sp. RSPAM1 TaxID=2675223 RepID=UPI00315CC3EE